MTKSARGRPTGQSKKVRTPKEPPFKGVVLTKLLQIRFGCPCEWQGETEKGELVGISYRFGVLKVNLGGKPHEFEVGDAYDGVMSQFTMLDQTGFVVRR